MTTTSMKLILSILPILIVGFIPELSTGNDHGQFVYTGFNSNLTLDGAARITSTGVIELIGDTARSMGHVVYPFPLCFRLSPDGMVQSFSTSFVFGILSSFGDIRGHGFAFFIGPSNDFTEAFPIQFLGLFNTTNNGSSINQIFAIELDTIQNTEFGDIDNNHVGIDINSLNSLRSNTAGFYNSGKNGMFTNLPLIGSGPIQTWVEYDGNTTQISVTLAPLGMEKPTRPLLSLTFNLSTVLKEESYVGFSSSTGLSTGHHCVLGWSFGMNSPAPIIDSTKLPKLPYLGQRSPSKLLEIILPIASAVLVLAIGTIAVILVRRHLRYKEVHEDWEVEYGPHRFDYIGESMYDDRGEDHSSMEEEEEVEGERTSCQLYSYQALEAATCQFSSSNKLGSGGFGTVYKGTLGNGKEVAVKRLRDSKKNIQELEREISMVANLHHKNLVRFLGHCFQEEGRFLVYEYVPNNSLEKFWYKASFQCQKLDWAAWHNIIIGVARGLRFLHNKGIIHRDLKPHNVLMDEHFNPKIADFDLMRVYDKQKTHESTEKAAGTLGYMAPECTSGRKFLLSIKSDVYSYGVLVLEIITGHKIYTFEGQNSEGLVEYVWQHWREKRVSDVVDGDLLAGAEEEGRQALRCVHVALLCVQADRSRRPAMGQVIAMLRREEMELQEPSLPGYVARPTTVASGVPLPCLGCR